MLAHTGHLLDRSHDVITHVYAEKMITCFRLQMQETERPATELHNLLKDYKLTLGPEGTCNRTEMFHCCSEYRHGPKTADKIFQNGNSWIFGLEARLKSDGYLIGRIGRASNFL